MSSGSADSPSVAAGFALVDMGEGRDVVAAVEVGWAPSDREDRDGRILRSCCGCSRRLVHSRTAVEACHSGQASVETLPSNRRFLLESPILA